MAIAIFDPDAFYPFRALVEGPLSSLDDLEAIEELVRAVVLHDQMVMMMEPFAYDGFDHEWTEEEIEAGGRTVVTAIGPVVDKYEVFTHQLGPAQIPDVELAPRLVELVAEFSNAEQGNVYYDAHVQFLKRIVGVLRDGGSTVCKGRLVQRAIETASNFPARFFEQLDADWRKFGQRANLGLEVFVPPILSIVLTRSANREAIPAVLRDLKDEWATAREKMWGLLAGLRAARTIAEAHAEAQAIERELRLASEETSSFNESSSRPFRVIWDLIFAGVGGGAVAGFAGGNILAGAGLGIIAETTKLVQGQADFAQVLFGRGAFDLARRIRRETARAEIGSLKHLLSEPERNALGL